MINSGFFSSESVTEGHPDKICDQISDTILDAALKQDPNARVACETFAGYDKQKQQAFILVAGELSYKGAELDYDNLVRQQLKNIGYYQTAFGIDYKSCDVIIKINTQSPDIAQGVDIDGAGDQGMMFGFAINETPEKMPLPIVLSHQLAKRLAQVRKEDKQSFLGPDGKAQVSLKYKNKKAEYISDVVISTQHTEDVDIDTLREYILKNVILYILPQELITSNTRFHINPTGRFVLGGPQGDTGLTGRKIIVDTYGGFARHGGGAFSGKDGTKVDRSGAYIARFIAKNIVAANIADVCEIQLAYVIGKPEPVSVYVDTFHTGKPHITDEDIADAIRKIFPLNPAGIIQKLQLHTPLYLQTSVYGHFGKPHLPWEQESEVFALKDYFQL